MKQNIVIDVNNLYVQGLIRIINRFMLEEVSDIVGPEVRMKDDITTLRRIFREDRKKMVIGGNAPMFSAPKAELYEIIFKQM